MKVYQTQSNIMLNHVIEQLAKYNVTDIKGKTYEQLIWILATKRASEVVIECSANEFF
jgi:hypothetical protein